MAGADFPQQLLSQVVFDAGACFLGGLGDGQPQLPFGHRGHQIAVLDRAGQLRVVRAAGLEIGAYAEDDQGRGLVVRPVPDGGRGVQRGDERAPLLFIRALGEQLLELVNHQQQLPAVLRRRSVRVGRRAPRLRQRRLSRGEREPGRIGVKSSPYFEPHPRLPAWLPGRRAHPAAPGPG